MHEHNAVDAIDITSERYRRRALSVRRARINCEVRAEMLVNASQIIEDVRAVHEMVRVVIEVGEQVIAQTQRAMFRVQATLDRMELARHEAASRAE